LVDSHGRTIADLRISLIDRCNFRCVYCMEPDVRFMPASSLMAAEEVIRVARVCVGLGVSKIRLTGGEPTLRPDLVQVIEGIAALGIDDLAMTTNGAVVDRADLERYKAAGLDRVTISLDSLRPERFAAMTRSGVPVGRVLETIECARAVGLDPVRVNAVIVRGQNEDELGDLAALARRLGVEVRFIEFMPLDSAHKWNRSRIVPAREMLERIRSRYRLVDLGRSSRSATAVRYGFADGAPGSIGLIAPVTGAFCGACSRLRITADAKIRPCLFSRREWDLMPTLRSGESDDEVCAFLQGAVWTKQPGHGIGSDSFVQPARPMSSIGG